LALQVFREGGLGVRWPPTTDYFSGDSTDNGCCGCGNDWCWHDWASLSSTPPH
jgi:hypothetical protein